MIKTGDKFTYIDLQQSLGELCGNDVRKYIDKKKSATGVVIGDAFIMINKTTPDEYATTAAQQYSDTPSSAISLDNQLRNRGFKTTYRFSYKYNYAGLTPQQIIHDAYYLDWFHQICETAVPQVKYYEKYFDLMYNAFRLSYYYAQYLIANNRRVLSGIGQKIYSPDISRWNQIINIILGVGFQFHPYDVQEYAIEHISPDLSKKQFNARYAQQLEFKTDMMNNYGIDTGCLVLSPQNREKLRKIVTNTDLPYWLQIIKNMIPHHNR